MACCSGDFLIPLTGVKKIDMTRRFYILLLAVGLPFYTVGAGWAGSGSGSEAASFLDIPIGAAPAALGSAYTARAEDAYAPVWNPAGLAYADATRLSGTHLAYLAGFHYEYAGLAVPLKNNQGLGASIQYLGADDFVAASEQGNITGTFSTTFAAYSLAYGRMFGPKWSLGLTGKLISEKIADASADGFAGDIGVSDSHATNAWSCSSGCAARPARATHRR